MIWSPEWFGPPCIDLRDAESFQQEHIKGTTSLPWSRLRGAMHELPDKHETLKLVGTDEQLSAASDFLAEKGYKIEAVYALDDFFWEWAQETEITETGCTSIPLWRANPLLEQHIETIEKLVTGRKALDLACGAGRDAAFLASRGWQVTAVDTNADALQRCENLAKSIDANVATLQVDLEETLPPMPNPEVDLIVVMRYLHRPLLPCLAEWLNAGGVICYSTFMVGSEQFGSPKNPNYLLSEGELANEFKELNVIIDKRVNLADGRPVAQFIAQK